MHSADINGKSKCLLCSRSTFISIGVDGDIVLIDDEFGTVFIGSVVVNFIDAFVRGKVVVTGRTTGRDICIIAVIQMEIL